MDQQEAKRRGLDELRDLRGEVKGLCAEMMVMRRSLESNLERWETYQTINYGQELGLLYQSMNQLEKRLAAVENSRLVAQPDALMGCLETASAAQFQQAIDALNAATGQYDAQRAALKEYQNQAQGMTRFAMLTVLALCGSLFVAVLEKWVF